jgi:hypothetical protein
MTRPHRYRLHDPDSEQIPTRLISIQKIMGSEAFGRGFDDARAGRPFDDFYGSHSGKTKERINRAWNYERGRQFAILAPRSMKLRIKGELNARAIQLYGSEDIP